MFQSIYESSFRLRNMSKSVWQYNVFHCSIETGEVSNIAEATALEGKIAANN